MKINVEFDLTPDEFRQALGLPNVEAFQQELLGRIQQQMESGVEGYDPMSLMRPFLQQPMMQQGLASFGNYQQMMLDMLSKAASQAGRGGDTSGASGQTSTSGQSAENASGSSSRKGAAAARSRAKRDNT
ncbi:hypothetical protein [Halomonas cerina]|uniref:Uncharacterized protein n=1 Tax=Halomonas cerina TaxID=447424 RepID=A0A839V6R0_9GAMM|nr:hypothetical protein [Halomonas cerina]MBB3190831.1 hypothetical protein [Halomonas cerina]